MASLRQSLCRTGVSGSFALKNETSMREMVRTGTTPLLERPVIRAIHSWPVAGSTRIRDSFPEPASWSVPASMTTRTGVGLRSWDPPSSPVSRSCFWSMRPFQSRLSRFDVHGKLMSDVHYFKEDGFALGTGHRHLPLLP